MQALLKYGACILCAVLLFGNLNAQTAGTKKTKAKSSAKSAPKASPTIEGKEVTIPITSKAEADVSIFAGKREDLKKPKLKTLGGLSKNTLYVRVNDVVCIINAAGKPVSCADIKTGTTALEINGSGNVITKK